MAEPLAVKNEIYEVVKTENVDKTVDNNEIVTQQEDGEEIHTVVLQNIQLESNEESTVLDQFEPDDSDGNLQIDTVEAVEEEVVHAYIIENDEYGQFNGHEILYETVEEDGTTVQYILEEAEEGEGHDVEYTYYTEQSEHDEVEEQSVDDPEEIEQVAQELSSDGEQVEVVDIDHNINYNNEDIKQASAETASKLSLVDLKQECHECDLCQKVFKTSAALKRHITVSHGQSTSTDDDPLSLRLCFCCGEPSDTAHESGELKCECGKFFTTTTINRHRSIEHPTDGKYKCVECKRQFKDKVELCEHMFLHPIKVFKCTSCGREFSRKYHLDRHIDQSGCSGRPKRVFECRVCKRFFTRKDNLAEHLRWHAGQAKQKRKYKCQYCQKEFYGANLLLIHERTHTGEKPYWCELCPKKFPSHGAMKKHWRIHTGEKPYRCDRCDKRFAAKETLNRHTRTHTGERPHQCQFCGKSFIQPSQLRAHIFHHTGENGYTCEYCGRAFNRRLRLTTHIKYMHEGADPIPCTVCGKTFFRNEDVARHMVCHTGEKPFLCEICNKGFAVKSSLKMHILTHKKEPPCSCDTCGRAFIRKDCLMRHMRAKHRDVLEDIMASAEKKRLQQQLLKAATDAASCQKLSENVIWNELTLTESVKELLTLLVEEESLTEFGYPDAPVDKVLDCVIRRCGHTPASEEDFDYIGRMRENAKLLFTVVIDDSAVKELLNNQTVDEVILQVLKLAKKQDD